MKYVFMKCVGLKNFCGACQFTANRYSMYLTRNMHPHPVENPVGPLCRSDILYISCLLMECTITCSRSRVSNLGSEGGAWDRYYTAKKERKETAVHIG